MFFNRIPRAAAKLFAVLALGAALPATALAGHGDVNWSVTVGSSGPAPVYVSPAPVYVQPHPVYVSPRPVYVQPGTVVHVASPRFGYGYQPPHHGHARGHWKHRHEHGHRGHDRHHRHHH